MPTKRPFFGNCLWAGVLLLVISILPASASPGVGLPNSIREVDVAPTSSPVDPHRAFVTRRVLKSEEAAVTMEFEVVLKMRNFEELKARIARGDRLSPQEMTDKYDPLAADYESTKAWLSEQGFEISRQDKNQLAVFARGKVSQIQQALQVNFARVDCENLEYTSAISAPYVPATLSPVLVGINGLQPHIRMRKHLVPRPNSLTGTNPPYLPGQIAQAYNANGLYNSGITGSGQAIAIVIDTFPNASDLTSFWSTCGINQSINNISFIQVVAGALPSPTGEETLDTEWSSAIAPAAKVRVYAVTSLTFANVDQAYQQIYSDVTNHPELCIHQMSMSYGLGEYYESSSQLDTDAQYFANLAAAGVTVFASSGDNGSNPNSHGSSGGPLQAESPACDPSVTSVGGTSLTLDTNGNASTETVWNDSYGASGGGSSRHFARPSWQTGASMPAGTQRLVPDVACSADPANGGVVILNGSPVSFGGTSWSTPTWAGFCALINQLRVRGGQSSVGLLGPSIYPQMRTAEFRDILSGNNGNYSAGTGYDLTTGIGVPDVQALAQTVAPQFVDTPAMPPWALVVLALLLFSIAIRFPLGCVAKRGDRKLF